MTTRTVTRQAGRRRRGSSATAYLFLIPTFASIIVFSYYPAIRALVGSFTNWDGFNTPKFIGFQNFENLFTDPTFLGSLWHVLVWTLIGIPLSIVPSFVVAELIFHLPGRRSQYFYRTVFILSMVVPTVVTVLVWENIYQPTGLINQTLKAIGLGSLAHQWLADPTFALAAVIVLGFPWVNPFNLLILYAGLQSIPEDVLDAASIDGAGAWRRVRGVDIPLLFSQVKLLLVLGIVAVTQNLLTPLLLTNGGPGTSTTTPVLYMYQTATAYARFGYGMAIAFLLFVVVGALAVVNMRYLQERT